MSLHRKIENTGIYVVHDLKGYEAREKMVIDLLHSQNNLDFEFVTESTESVINEDWIKQYFIQDIRSTLSKGSLFCTLKHILIYERFLKSDHKYAIIFENDICFLKPFEKNMLLINKEADLLPEGFMISLENSTLQFPSWKETKRGKYLYEAEKGRCAGAYMIDKKAAADILYDLKEKKCALVIDWWHNDLLKRKVAKMYWAHPPLTEQGSSNGMVPSSSSGNPGGSLQYFRWTMQKFYKMYIIRWFR